MCVRACVCVIFYADFLQQKKSKPPLPPSPHLQNVISNYTTPVPYFPQISSPSPPKSEFRLIYIQMIMKPVWPQRTVSPGSPPGAVDNCVIQTEGVGSPPFSYHSTAFACQGPSAPRPPCEQLLSVAFSPVQADARPPRSTCRDRWTLSLTTGCPSPLPRSGTPPTEVRTTRRQCPPGFLLPPLSLPIHPPPPSHPPPVTLIWFLVFFYYYNCRLWWPACLPVLGDWSFTTYSPTLITLSVSYASWFF